MKRYPLSLYLGAGIVVLVLLAALAGPWLAPYAPDAIALDARLLPPGPGHWAGTDEVGRDILSRMLWGLRASLTAGLSIVVTASLVGTMIGSISGTIGGTVDMVLMRAMDMVMSLPGLVVAMALTAALGASLGNAVLALAVLSIPYYARVARAQAMAVTALPYVKAAVIMGAGPLRLLRVHVLPNIAAQIMVVMSLHIGSSILAVAALGFIGLGAQPPMAELGMLVNAGRRFVLEHWWYSAFPGLLIIVAVLGFNLLGDGLRDLLDPKARNRSLVS